VIFLEVFGGNFQKGIAFVKDMLYNRNVNGETVSCTDCDVGLQRKGAAVISQILYIIGGQTNGR